ncbi:MAG: hypothetical protein IKW89_14325 [Bacteroidales bacterium]|nr:hypothetical protein [Bacteroidales bacterium]
MTKHISIFLGLVAVLMLLSSCREEVPQELRMPQVTGWEAVPGIRSAMLQASFDRGDNMTACGFKVWPASSGTEISIGTLPGQEISAEVSELEPDTEYSWTVYYTNGLDVVETPVLTFRTKPQPQVKPDPPTGQEDPGTDPVDIPDVDPDPTLWEYIVSKYDMDADGVMSDEELLEIQELQISDLPVDSLAGLEALVNLRTLGMGGHYLKRIDLSANKNLELLYAGREALLEEFYLDNPKLGYLYLIECKVLKALDFSRCPEITMLELYNNQSLESIDLSKNRKLEVFRLTGSKVKELDLSNCRRIQQLSSEDNPLLEKVILHKEAAPEVLSVESHTKIVYQ